ncbi:hypothetical protein B0H19DRAFT_1276769 [Mycena capillaripes]|nr:hypothetical protein B0H19DRAFT_1276769 [Mycena capillaripes]
MLRLTSNGKYLMNSGRSVADVAYPQLKDFSLSSAVPPLQLQEVLDSGFTSSSALWHFLRCVVLGGDLHTLTTEHLLKLPHRHKVSMFSRIIYWLIPNTREARSKQMRDLCTVIGGRAQLNNTLTKFLLDLTHSDQLSKYALLDAVMVLIVPLLIPNTPLKSGAIQEDLFRRSHLFPSLKLRPSYSWETLTLLDIIRENRLAAFIGPPGSRSSREIAQVLEPICKA